MNPCHYCPILTTNLDNWCEDCLFTREVGKTHEKIAQLNKSLKPLMRDPNWEDFSHPYEAYEGK